MSMHACYRGYCRGVQIVFRAALPVLPYRNPKSLRNVTQVPEELRARGIDRVLIVTDRVLHQLGLLDPLKQCLREQDIGYAIYDGTVANPTVNNVEEAREMYLAQQCGGIIGFGGGSAIDCAKAVGARIARPRKPVAKMRGILQVMRKTPFFIAVPTTAGTGSEVTLATVITDSDTGHKFPINDFALIPDAAVLDPENMRSMPRAMTATTGMDALTHAVEAYIGRSTTKSTRADALEAVRLIFDNLEKAYEDGSNMVARTNMMYASYLAGRAFSKSYVGYVHAVAHSLGGRYNIPHGLANAVLLPIGLETYGPCIHKKLHRLAVVAGMAAEKDSPRTAAEKFIEAIYDMNRRMQIPAALEAIRSEDIPEMAAHAAREANPLYPVPKLMDASELMRIYEVASGEWMPMYRSGEEWGSEAAAKPEVASAHT